MKIKIKINYMVFLKQFLVFFTLSLLLIVNAKSQDTNYVKSIETPFYVNNVTSDGKTLFIRSADSIYSWENSKLEFIASANSRYSWYNSTDSAIFFTHTAYIPKLYKINKNSKYLVPGYFNGNITSTRVNDYIYISYNGKIIQYHIQSNIEHLFKGNSVRHIYMEPSGVRVISTYSGVFVDLKRNKINKNTFKNPKLKYSTGSFNKINNRYFLCQDDLLEFDSKNEKFIRRILTEGKPQFRQLFKFNGNVFSIMTKGFNMLNIENFEFDKYMLPNEKITGYQVIDSVAILSSRENGLFVFDTALNFKKLNVPVLINDIINYKKELLLCTDDGLYSLNIKTGNYKQITSEKYLHTIVKYKNGVIYSGDRGLYWFNGSKSVNIITEEFNKLALYTNNKNLYAGSINGLFIIGETDLKLTLNENSDKIIYKGVPKENTKFNFYLIITLLFILIFGLFGFILLRKKHKNEKSDLIKIQNSREEITVSTVKLAIFQDESIKSVNDIALHFNTSISQVNRRLKLENTSPLECLKETKQKIITQMKQEGKSIEEMTKRVGYSKRFIRENFLS